MCSSGSKLLECLLIVSEKAACIARTCREESKLFALLVEEKQVDKEWKRADFKTLADVLIQEMIRYELEDKFPDLRGSIFGEENNEFTNTLGESIALTLSKDRNITLQLLTQVLDGNADVAVILTEKVYSQINITNVPVDTLPTAIPDLDMSDLAVWIDPIDATHEYIHGKPSKADGVDCCGLNCVSVIIGVFRKSTGEAIAGVINQPFYPFALNKCDIGRCFWGVCVDEHQSASVSLTDKSYRTNFLLAVSSCETDSNCAKLKNAGYELISPSGAGYKCLCVILGEVDAYLLTFSSTYFWDTCGCHAIIKSLGGNIWQVQEFLLKNVLQEVKYTVKDNSSTSLKHYLNASGILVCRNKEESINILLILK